MAGGHLWSELLSILPGAGHGPLSPGQGPHGQVPTLLLLPAYRSPPSSPSATSRGLGAASPGDRASGGLRWRELQSFPGEQISHPLVSSAVGFPPWPAQTDSTRAIFMRVPALGTQPSPLPSWAWAGLL